MVSLAPSDLHFSVVLHVTPRCSFGRATSHGVQQSAQIETAKSVVVSNLLRKKASLSLDAQACLELIKQKVLKQLSPIDCDLAR